ncbi:MAG TPA: tetratricopeptide repeat protein [Candidatus Angelobacter sp.]|nr:tetratricopeptide repeat protein [Candidatus Angelobacter sp.]
MISPVLQAAAQTGPDVNPNDPDRQKAFELYRQQKMPEAAVLLEQVVAKYPKDTGAHEAFGSALLSRAETQTEIEKRKADRLHARAELQKAKDLGDTSDLCRVLLAGIPEDGSDIPFSDKASVNGAMNRGEAAFAKGEWQEAIKEYTVALELDPTLYFAAVNIGDTYFRLKENDKAGEWFARAIQIDPNQETAYRYWGDALMQGGRIKEARTKFIQGLVAYPYRQTSWGGLNGWLSRNRLKYKSIPIKVPEGPKTGSKGETIITVDPAQADSSTAAAWMVYPMERSLWQKEKFAKVYPQEKSYRHSLKEEAAALTLSAKVYQEIQAKKNEKPDPGLSLLSQFVAEGMIEPYVLLITPDQGIAQDFAAYRDAHREKLIEFVDKYLVPPAP